MKNNLLISLLLIVTILSTAITLAELLPEEEDPVISLNQGKNEIIIPENTSSFYVKDLVIAYPEILTVTYFKLEDGNLKEKGFVNVFGGIGENFIIYPNQKYNITVSKNMEVDLI